MPPRPELLHLPTSNTVEIALQNLSEYGRDISDEAAHETSSLSPSTHDTPALAPGNPSEYGMEDISVLDETAQETSHLSPSIHDTPVLDMEAGVIRTLLHASTRDILLLAGIFVMLVWPWIFLAIVWGLGGVQMSTNVTRAVIAHPQNTNFFATFLGYIIAMIVSTLFSVAIVRFAQEWVTNNAHVTVFHVSLISAFRHQNWPWSVKDLNSLFDRTRWLPVLSVGVCISAFALVPSGVTSLVTPVPFHRTVPLTGTELDFSSSAADCVDWFKKNPGRSCEFGYGINRQQHHFSFCTGWTRRPDFLESGRGNIRSLLSNNSESLALSYIGAKSGLHFLGPMRGVLPIDPDSLPGFDTLQPSTFFDVQTQAATLSYNYTLNHQGLASKINCVYDTQSPINFVPGGISKAVDTGNCSGLGDDLIGGALAPDINNYSSVLTFWACKSLQGAVQEPSYFIYLRGYQRYEQAFGNITCTVSPVQPAIFPVTYQSSTDTFSSTGQIAISESANTFSGFVEIALLQVGDVITRAQSWIGNQMAESIITFAVQSSWVPPFYHNETYLRLYEAMIQGILVEEITYTRFTYSIITNPQPPLSCLRTVDGSLSYEVIGWFAKPVHIGFLMPMTIVNLASLVLILISMSRAKRGCHEFDPTDPRPLVLAESTLDEGEPTGWADGVRYRPREVSQ